MTIGLDSSLQNALCEIDSVRVLLHLQQHIRCRGRAVDKGRSHRLEAHEVITVHMTEEKRGRMFVLVFPKIVYLNIGEFLDYSVKGGHGAGCQPGMLGVLGLLGAMLVTGARLEARLRPTIPEVRM